MTIYLICFIEQPATQTAAGFDYSQNTGYNETTQYTGYDQQYTQQNMNQEGYAEGYEEENQQPSLSDYNSHECCVRITTKKYAH